MLWVGGSGVKLPTGRDRDPDGAECGNGDAGVRRVAAVVPHALRGTLGGGVHDFTLGQQGVVSDAQAMRGGCRGGAASRGAAPGGGGAQGGRRGGTGQQQQQQWCGGRGCGQG